VNNQDQFRSLPSVEHLLQTEQSRNWSAAFGRSLTLEALRASLEAAREQIRLGSPAPGPEGVLAEAEALLERWTAPTLQPVINATGTILHTNLGRAPLSRAAGEAMLAVSLGYSTLEYDLQKGGRGSRLVHAEALVRRVTGAEAALVVNNNAAAVLLALTALARRRAVVIARTQLVEIGGGFRLPDVMKQSGARLVEIGATNRVNLGDYQAALAENPALILRAHRSNFQLLGFTGEPALEEIARVAHEAGLPLVDDLGSGTLLDTAQYGLAHEPTVQERLAGGADLVCFSGDKLLGGPQAGIIAGRASLIAKLKAHPLARALRADKLCLAGLSATLLHYLKGEAGREIPVWRMISMPVEAIQARAGRWRESLGQGELRAGESTVGGGSLPGETLPTCLLALSPRSPTRFLAALREGRPPVIARVETERVLLDPRTVLEEQDESLLARLKSIIY
jgi:L-seryl-tRNA(Ser) seleniumtransferase